MSTKSRSSWGRRAFRAVLLVSVMMLVFRQLIPVPPPSEVSLRAPTTLRSGLKLRGEPAELRWSPDGRYLAVVTTASSGWEVAVVDCTAGHGMRRIPFVTRTLGSMIWGSDNGLWLQGVTGWEVHRPPFDSRPDGRLPMPIRALSSTPDEMRWLLDPDRQLIIAASDRSSSRTGAMEFRAWRAGKQLWKVPLEPRVPASSRDLVGFTFSPDRAQLAFTVSGWISYETSGSDELWTIDAATGKLRFLHSGRNNWWEIVDNSVQDARAAWSPDGRSIVYGDSTFGLESLDTNTRRIRRLLPARWGNDARVGQEWVAFQSYGRSRHPGSSLGVVSRDGKQWGRLPGEFRDAYPLAFEWDRSGTQLALVVQEGKLYWVLVWRAPP